MPIHLKEDLIVELALMHKYGIITVLPISKRASPILYKRIATENYVSLWISGKSTHWGRMITLTIITQSPLCQMQHNNWQGSHYSASLTALRLITACRWRNTVRWKCLLSILLAERLPTKLAQALSRSVSAFSSFLREYLDPVVKADQCAQYVDDIGIAANNATDLTGNIREVSQCIRNAGLKLTIEMCHLGVR